MKKSKVIVILVIILFVLIQMPSCVKDSVNSRKVVYIWTYYKGAYKEIFEEMVDEFNKEKGVENNTVVIHRSFNSIYDIDYALTRAAKDKSRSLSMPDIFITYKGVGMLVDKERPLIDFNDYYSKNELNKYVKDFVEMGKVGKGENERLIMFPVAKSADILMINDTDFKKFISELNKIYDMKQYNYDEIKLEKYEDLIKFAELYYDYTDKLTPRVPFDGKAMFGMDSVANYFFIGLKQQGTDFLYRDDNDEYKTKASFNKDHIKRLWDNYYTPTVKGYCAKKGRFVTEDIGLGRLLMGVSYTTSSIYFPKEAYDDESDGLREIDLKVAKVPYISSDDENDDVQRFFIQGGGAFVVDGGRAKNEAAVSFIKWFTDTHKNADFAIRASYFPVTQEAYDEKYIENHIENINKLANKGEEQPIDKNVLTTLINGVKQYKPKKDEDNRLGEVNVAYTPEVLVGYEEVRKIIEKSFEKKANDTAEKVRKVKRDLATVEQIDLSSLKEGDIRLGSIRNKDSIDVIMKIKSRLKGNKDSYQKLVEDVVEEFIEENTGEEAFGIWYEDFKKEIENELKHVNESQ